jgi:translation initiation factor IF-3
VSAATLPGSRPRRKIECLFFGFLAGIGFTPQPRSFAERHLESTAISTNFRHNDQIRISPIFLIDENETKVGAVSTGDALKRARELGMDLVEVAPNGRPPVCRIMDYGKWRYQQQKKDDKSRTNSKAGQLKELKLRTVKIGDHDLNIKINHARGFLKEGNKVQFTLQFRGREMAHMDLGHQLFRKIKEELFAVSKPERDSKMEGRRMTLVLQPDHKSEKQLEKTAEKNAEKSAAPSFGSKLNIPAKPAEPKPAAPAPAAVPAPIESK